MRSGVICPTHNVKLSPLPKRDATVCTKCLIAAIQELKDTGVSSTSIAYTGDEKALAKFMNDTIKLAADLISNPIPSDQTQMLSKQQSKPQSRPQNHGRGGSRRRR